MCSKVLRLLIVGLALIATLGLVALTPASAVEDPDLNGNGFIDSRNELVAIVMEAYDLKLSEAAARLDSFFGVDIVEDEATRRMNACSPDLAERLLRAGASISVGAVEGPATGITIVAYPPVIRIESLGQPCPLWIHEGAHGLTALYGRPHDLLAEDLGMSSEVAAECLADRLARAYGVSAEWIDGSVEFHRSVGIPQSWACIKHSRTGELAALLVAGSGESQHYQIDGRGLIVSKG